MLLGVLSDTHNQRERTVLACKLLRDARVEKLFHCGDYTGRAIIEACAGIAGYFVYGNNDADNIPELQQAISEIGGTNLEWGGAVELDGVRIAMTHGHMTKDVRRLLADAPDYLFVGHSHLQGDVRVGNTRKINPGALHRARGFSVATLDTKSGELRFWELPKN